MDLQEAYGMLRRQSLSPRTPKAQRDALNVVLERIAEVSPYVNQPSPAYYQWANTQG